MRGLDPRIHAEAPRRRNMDCRIKPGNDEIKAKPMTEPAASL
jgi:hypothetical protein